MIYLNLLGEKEGYVEKMASNKPQPIGPYLSTRAQRGEWLVEVVCGEGFFCCFRWFGFCVFVSLFVFLFFFLVLFYVGERNRHNLFSLIQIFFLTIKLISARGSRRMKYLLVTSNSCR